MGTLNLRDFPQDLHDALRIEAAKRRSSIKGLLVVAAREWLAREQEQAKAPGKPKRREKG